MQTSVSVRLIIKSSRIVFLVKRLDDTEAAFIKITKKVDCLAEKRLIKIFGFENESILSLKYYLISSSIELSQLVVFS